MSDYKEMVKIIDELPQIGNEIGDKRAVLFNKKLYQWNGTAWVEIKNYNTSFNKYFKIGV